MKMSILAMLLLSSALFAAEEKKEDTSPVSTGNEVAVITTSEGDMVVEFWTDAAPNTIENFKKLARAGFYNGTIFHRIVKAFMIQGGDPNSKDPSKENRYGEGGPGYKIKAEFNDHLHERGVISMAREPDPDSAGSQFFICLALSIAVATRPRKAQGLSVCPNFSAPNIVARPKTTKISSWRKKSPEDQPPR